MKNAWLVAIFLLVGSATQGQILSPEAYRMIRANVSGQRPFGDFRNLTQFSGFASSAGADQIANYLLLEARRVGLANAEIERFPSDGKTYVGRSGQNHTGKRIGQNCGLKGPKRSYWPASPHTASTWLD